MIDVVGARAASSVEGSTSPAFSIVVPCYNEEASIAETVEALAGELDSPAPYEVIVVDDGSKDDTAKALARIEGRFQRLRVISHANNRGYGAALKTGILAARSELIAITDADGTYPNERLPELVARCAEHQMVVGARVGDDVSYSKLRAIPKLFLSRWVSWLARRHVPDVNSGMRVIGKAECLRFFSILPDGFSFTITITLAMLTTFRSVEFVPISYKTRIGKSKIQPIRDTLRFIGIILRTGVYFAPVRAFAPFILVLLVAASLSLAYDVLVLQDLTEKTLLLFLFAMNTGMFTLLADMIDKRANSGAR